MLMAHVELHGIAAHWSMYKGGEHGYQHLAINQEICYWHHDESFERQASMLEHHLHAKSWFPMKKSLFACMVLLVQAGWPSMII